MTTVNPYESPRHEPARRAGGTLPIRLSGVVTAQDSLDALAAVGKWRPWRLPLIVAMVLAFVTFVVLLAGPAGVLNPSYLIIVWTAGIYLMTASFRGKRRFIRVFNARTEFREPVSWTFSQDGLLSETIHSTTFRKWQGFAYGRITPALIILAHPGESMINFVPRRLFETEDDCLAVTRLLGEKIPVR